MTDWHSYLAGFFDGEGSLTIARQRSGGKSDYHLVLASIGQRAKYRAILDRVALDFGGRVSVRQSKTRVSHNWAEYAVWQLSDKAGLRRFLLAIQPHCIVKAEQVSIALEFLETFVAGRSFRDDLGRIHGRFLTADEIERRERIRLRMREVNEKGSTRVKRADLAPLDLEHRRRTEAERVGNRATIQRGEQRPAAKLTEAIVRQMRLDYATGCVTLQDLATRYGVSLMTSQRAVTGKTWKHVEQVAADAPAFSQPTLFDGAI